MAAGAPTGNLPSPGEDYDLIVLAGGAGTRLGNTDKGLIKVAGRSLLDTLLSRLATPGRRVIISANRNQASYATLGDHVVSDLRAGFAGPLAGIEAALAVSESPVCIVLPCDMPRLPPDLPAALLQQLGSDNIAAYLHDGKRPQPLCLALRRQRAAPALTGFLENGQRSVIRWLEHIQATQLDGSHWPDTCWANINDPSELEKLLQQA